MTAYPSQTLLNDLAQRVVIIRDKIIKNRNAYTGSMLVSDISGKWNAAQCLDHLNSYGNYYLPAIEKAIAQNKNSNAEQSFKSSWLGNYFYTLMLPEQQGKKFKKMKSPKNHAPLQNPDAEQTVNEFLAQTEKLLNLLEKSERINISKAKVPISIAKFIKLQLGDVFLFLIAHMERHVLQAEKTFEQSTLIKMKQIA